MNIAVAIDSFKGSLTSMEAGLAVSEGILRAIPKAHVTVKPLADGGEGTTDALTAGLGGESVSVTVTGPCGAPVTARYGCLRESGTAVMEMAGAAGITLVPNGKKDPMKATTYGVGEMILDAVKRGCRHFLMGIGGSATNDGGIGMLTALGYEFLDREGRRLPPDASALARVVRVRTDHVCPELAGCRFDIACDVSNPLTGPRGATWVYGPQKGVTEEMKPLLDQAMARFGAVTAACTGHDHSQTPGAGAAGGLGFAFLSYFRTVLTPGAELIIRATGLDRDLELADVAVTGEGRLDGQTAMGKAPVCVARHARRHGCTVVALAGCVTEEAAGCHEAGIDAFFPVLRQAVTLEEAMEPEQAKKNLSATAEQVFRLIRAVRHDSGGQ